MSSRSQAVNKECMFVLDNDEELKRLYGTTKQIFTLTVCRQPAKIAVQCLLDPILLRNIGVNDAAKLTTYVYLCKEHQTEVSQM